MKKYKSIVVILVLVIFIGLAGAVISKNSYSLGEKSFTREEMQNMIIATTLSYYNNNYYSDYGQLSMDNLKISNNYYNSGTFYWRDINVNPEMAGRSNYFHTDCAAFAFSVYLHTFGYDKSEFKDLNTAMLFYKDQEFKMMKANKFDDLANSYKETYTRFGPGGGTYTSTYIANKISNSCATNTCVNSNKTGIIYDNLDNSKSTELAYYYVANGHETPDKLKSEYSKIKDKLEPGDILLYRIYKSNGTYPGHVMIYVGENSAFTDYKINFIHSTGYDYTTDITSSRNKLYKGRAIFRSNADNYMENAIDNAENQNGYLYLFAIFRPINTMCKSDDDCSLSYNSNNIPLTDIQIQNDNARIDLLKLRTEQWMSENKKYSALDASENLTSVTTNNIKSKYNSINIYDNITYNLRLTNKYDNTSTTGLTIRAEIPDDTTFISCTYDCTVNGNEITWESVFVNGKNTYKTFSYTVQALKEGIITNNGMKVITKNNNVLTMAPLTIDVKPTLNGINKEIFMKAIDKFKKLTEEGKITYSSSGSRTQNIKDLDTLLEAQISQMGFIKMIYYNALGLDLDKLENEADYINTTSIKNAIFDSVAYPTLNNNGTLVNGSYPAYTGDTSIKVFAKKTDTSSLTGATANINKMLVSGLYGGGYLKGNDNGDRVKFLRCFMVPDVGMQSDLEFGDIIYIFSSNSGVLNSYMYLGNDEYGPVLAQYKTNGELVLYTDKYLSEYYSDESLQSNSNNKPSNQILNEMFAKDLFVILRPSKLGTTIKYDYNGGEGKDINYVAYNTYRNLDTPTKEGYKVTFDYKDEENFENQEIISKNTFAGWYLDKNFTTKITNTSALKSTNAHTIYAKWTSSSITLPNLKKAGHYLAGWYNGTTKVGQGGDYYTTTKDIVLTPIFIELPKVSLELIIKDNSTINVKVTKTKGVLTGYEIYKYNNSSKSYELIKVTTDLNTTIIHDFKTGSKTKIYVKPYVEIEGEKIYGENSIEKEIEQEIEEHEKEEVILTKPTGLKASSLDYRSLYISWNKVKGADGYQIYKKGNTSNNYVSLGHITKNYVTARNGVITGKTVYYKIRAYKIVDNKKKYGPFSNVVSGKAMLNAPANGKGSSTGYKSGYLSYSKISGATGYQIYKLSSITGKYYSLGYTKNNYAYAKTGLTTGKTAYYKIRAYRVVSGKKVYGLFSKVISFKPIPSTPKNVRADKYRSGVAKIRWSKVTGATGYNIYKYNSTTKKYYYVKSTRSLSTTTSYGLRKGTSTYYKVKAYRIVNGKKIFSNFSYSDYVKV